MLSSETQGKVDPDILTEYRYADLKINEQEMADLLQEGKRDEAYRQLLVAQCNELNDIMPFMFEKIADYTELLLPDNLLHADSIINRLVNDLEEENFEQVEVIGWLYQYYISEKKDEVFAGLKKIKKLQKKIFQQRLSYLHRIGLYDIWWKIHLDICGWSQLRI